MPLMLNTPKVETREIDELIITQFINDIENKFIQINYVEKNSGKIVRRSKTKIAGKDGVKALYAELDAIIAEGHTFEEASTVLLYSKLADLSDAEIVSSEPSSTPTGDEEGEELDIG